MPEQTRGKQFSNEPGGISLIRGTGGGGKSRPIRSIKRGGLAHAFGPHITRGRVPDCVRRNPVLGVRGAVLAGDLGTPRVVYRTTDPRLRSGRPACGTDGPIRDREPLLG